MEVIVFGSFVYHIVSFFMASLFLCWFFVVYAFVIFSFFSMMGLLNEHHPSIRRLTAFFTILTEPPLDFLRRWMPFLQGPRFDWSPLVLLFLSYIAYRFVALL